MLPKEVSLPALLFVLVVAIIIIGSCVTAYIAGISSGLFCGLKYRQKKEKKTISSSIQEEKSIISTKGPIYEEVDLDDKTANIDLSQNIAYEL